MILRSLKGYIGICKKVPVGGRCFFCHTTLPADLANKVTKVSLFIDVLAIGDLLGVFSSLKRKKRMLPDGQM